MTTTDETTTSLKPEELEQLNEDLMEAKMQLVHIRPALNDHWALGHKLRRSYVTRG